VKDAPARLIRALTRVTELREPARLTEPVRDMLRVLRAKGFSDLDVDALRGEAEDEEALGALEALGRRFPEIDPLLRNTYAITTLSGGFKPNVIPSLAEGTIDARIVPGEEPEAVAARVRALVADLDVSVEILFAEKPNGSPMGPLYGAMEAAVLSVHPDAVVVPYMSTGFTDSRFFRSIGIPTYGLMPVLLPRAEHGKIHGVDERIPVAGIEEMTRVVSALIERWNA
jgi:acetylornithine deacetylase/succinyl-diaminopimelate desuccinylase-like protein